MGVFGFLGSLVPGVGSYLGQKEANKANRELAREQMEFQERMSSTSYQRAVEDMKLAGINPMLAYMQGGASSPGGQTATMQDVIGPAVSSALHATRLRKELKLLDAQRMNVDADTWKKSREANVTDAIWRTLSFGPEGGPSYAVLKVAEEYRNLVAEGKRIDADRKLKELQAMMARIGIPSAEVFGSKPAAIIRLLFGGQPFKVW